MNILSRTVDEKLNLHYYHKNSDIHITVWYNMKINLKLIEEPLFINTCEPVVQYENKFNLSMILL